MQGVIFRKSTKHLKCWLQVPEWQILEDLRSRPRKRQKAPRPQFSKTCRPTFTQHCVRTHGHLEKLLEWNIASIPPHFQSNNTKLTETIPVNQYKTGLLIWFHELSFISLPEKQRSSVWMCDLDRKISSNGSCDSKYLGSSSFGKKCTLLSSFACDGFIVNETNFLWTRKQIISTVLKTQRDSHRTRKCR